MRDQRVDQLMRLDLRDLVDIIDVYVGRLKTAFGDVGERVHGQLSVWFLAAQPSHCARRGAVDLGHELHLVALLRVIELVDAYRVGPNQPRLVGEAQVHQRSVQTVRDVQRFVVADDQALLGGIFPGVRERLVGERLICE